MTKTPDNMAWRQPAANDDVPSDRAVLLRAAADCELTPQQERALEAHLHAQPSDRAVIAFERMLREAIAACAVDQPSVQLRARVQGLIESPADHAGSIGVDAPEVMTASRTRRPLRWLAVAASLALLIGGAYIVVQSIQGFRPGEGQLIGESYRVSLVSFVSSHHEECELHTDMAMREFNVTAIDQAPGTLAKVLGTTPDLGTLAQSGLRFVGGGRCAVPGRGLSVHMVFEASEPADGERRPMVSLFVQQDTGELRIEAGRTYRLLPKSAAIAADRPCEIYVWNRDGLVYFLASTAPPAMTTVLAAIGASEPGESI